jgi:hypothetical protein
VLAKTASDGRPGSAPRQNTVSHLGQGEQVTDVIASSRRSVRTVPL